MLAAAIALPPLLREGDRLDSSEFLRRWEAMPSLKQAELIDGVVYMPSPVLHPHAKFHSAMDAWVWCYQDATLGCESGTDCTWVMGPKDVPQPDIYLRILSEYGGQSKVEHNRAEGAPELIVEVSWSSVSRDLGVKLDLYCRAGVREYLTVLLEAQEVVWRRLWRGRYREVAPDDDGLLRSRVFPGLWLDPTALWSPKRSIQTALKRGIRSPEHAAFVERLAAHKRKS
jgi:Uma2 family endonuclease